FWVIAALSHLDLEVVPGRGVEDHLEHRQHARHETVGRAAPDELQVISGSPARPGFHPGAEQVPVDGTQVQPVLDDDLTQSGSDPAGKCEPFTSTVRGAGAIMMDKGRQ